MQDLLSAIKRVMPLTQRRWLRISPNCANAHGWLCISPGHFPTGMSNKILFNILCVRLEAVEKDKFSCRRVPLYVEWICLPRHLGRVVCVRQRYPIPILSTVIVTPPACAWCRKWRNVPVFVPKNLLSV